MTAKSSDNLPDYARNAINLASAGLGARAIDVTDQFFAPLARMLAPSDPVFIPDKYDDNGKWMDGWETRRRRNGGHDIGTIALAARGRITGFNVDTRHFTGNNAPACRIEACDILTDPNATTRWTEILPTVPLDPDSEHFFACGNDQLWTHLRLHIYPDGGVARLRVFGEPYLDPERVANEEIDLAASLNGGRGLAYSDSHYGSIQQLLAPGRGENMGDGWETRRRRKPGYDWAIIELGARGTVSRVVVDTAHFKGNYPDACAIQAADLTSFSGNLNDAIVSSSLFWETLLPLKKLSADTEHVFSGSDEIESIGPVTHVRLNIFPDGGISRLRLFGRVA